MKKGWIWLSVIGGIILILIILTFTLFSLKTAKIQFHNNTTLFASESSQNEILETANLPYGHSVLFMNKQNCVDRLEKEYPFLEIVNIETVFPNSVIVHCNQREEVFAVKFDGGYYFCDTDLKILEISTNQFESTQNNLIELTTYSIIPTTLTVGEFIDIPETNILKNISPAFELTNRNISAQMALIKKMQVVNTYNPAKPLADISYGLKFEDFTGLQAIFSAPDSQLVEKINKFCAYQTVIADVNQYYLYVYEEDGNVLVAQRPFSA